MGLNQNHTAEELNGTRCAIVEKNVTPERAQFLAALLSGNGYEVHCVPAAPPKAKVAAAPKEVPASEGASPDKVETTPATPIETGPTLFTVGVTDVTFNPINAIYGRLLRTKDGHIVTADYWSEKDTVSHDDIPYYEVGSTGSPTL